MSELNGSGSYDFRVHNLTLDGTQEEVAKALGSIFDQLEELGASISCKRGYFEPDSPSILATPRTIDNQDSLLTTYDDLRDFAATDLVFYRFPVRTFWESLLEHCLIAHPGIDGSPPIPLGDAMFMGDQDPRVKRVFYSGMEPCECSLRAYGYSGLDSASIVSTWSNWDNVRPGRLWRFGKRNQQFLGAVAQRLAQDI